MDNVQALPRRDNTLVLVRLPAFRGRSVALYYMPQTLESVLWSRRARFDNCSVLERLLFLHPSTIRAFDLAVAFRVYHDVKVKRLDHVLTLRDTDVRSLARLVKQSALGARKALA